MRNIPQLMLLGVVQLGLVACATVPSTDELQQLDGEALQSALVGNTSTYRADYGRWAEYIESGDAGYGKASGNWGSQSATASYTFKDDGEWCATYSGSHDWSQPGNEYCAIVYTDEDGNYYSKVTKNTDDPNKVGNTRKIEIKAGDAYGLGE